MNRTARQLLIIYMAPCEEIKATIIPRHMMSQKIWGERRGLNPRQPDSQSGALPTELRPPYETIQEALEVEVV